jgi:hypothetical protein
MTNVACLLRQTRRQASAPVPIASVHSPRHSSRVRLRNDKPESEHSTAAAEPFQEIEEGALH